MTNVEVVKNWVDYCKAKPPKSLLKWHATANVHCSSKQLFSYNTPIAEYKDNKFYLTKVKYSVTTSKHQNLVKHFVPTGELVLVDNEINKLWPSCL